MNLSLRFSRFYFAYTVLFFLFSGFQATAQEGWLTYFEKSGFRSSPDYRGTMQWLNRLDSVSDWVSLQYFGTTPQGRPLPFVILSNDGAFTPEEAHATGKDIILIQAGIHSGEIDGKDAMMMLLREIAVTKTVAKLADNTIVLFIPIFNLDGHERRSPYNRINQIGPDTMGWRTTAHNLNLNRDFMKADAPEMRAWLALFNTWLPDMVIDCHVTDGIDFQYNITYAMETAGNIHPSIEAWEKKLQYWFIDAMEKKGEPMIPYVFPREDSDLSKGLMDWAFQPRLSTGYAAIRNRANLLIEAHSLKPFKDRVFATCKFLQSVLEFNAAYPGTLRKAVQHAEEEDIRRFSAGDTTAFPIGFVTTNKADTVQFKGYASELRNSSISGGQYIRWDRSRPQTTKIPIFRDIQPKISIRPPRFYLIPQEWTTVLNLLRLHGVQLHRLTQETQTVCESTVFRNPVWRKQPFEGRVTVSAETTVRSDSVRLPAGTFVVDLAQPSARVAINLLEADAPDSFVFWGFFNSIFEQKEYYESYIMEDVAADMLRNDPRLKEEFERRLKEDPEFASSPKARLDFFYERSHWHDSQRNLYPVLRCMSSDKLVVVPEKEWDRNVEQNK